MSSGKCEVYKQRAIAFLDILGFKEHIAAERESELLEALRIPTTLQTDFLGGISAKDCEISTFSDSIVISTTLHDVNGQPAGGAYLLVFLTSYLQLKLMALGILLRGGATVGKLHHKNGILLGPAMIEAHEIESKLAVYPRVAVSPELRERYNAEMEYFRHTNRSTHASTDEKIILDMIEETFWTGDDGVPYINCLGRHSPLPPAFVCDSTKLHERGHPARYGLDGGLAYKLQMARKPLTHPASDTRAAAKHYWFATYLAKLESSESKLYHHEPMQNDKNIS